MLMPMKVSANGNLTDLITELQHIKKMVAQQKKVANSDGQRIVFRYDLVEHRIDTLIVDIEKHLALMSVQPRRQLTNEGYSR
ncbi:hypothetical protein AB833_13905 [Chromatiales bacterium (ex Bugula neritina AB1)]|nr:hypothetical protein AB833_13905 [Chromatiales bacterium (ex Bugula neritina AB1)]